MTFMMTMIPPQEQSRRDQLRANKTKDNSAKIFETPEQTQQRYEEIANDLVSVVYDPKNKPIFKGPDGRAHTAAVMLSIIFHESGFRRDVDKGEISGRGDYGSSWCLMQIRAGKFPSKTRPWNFIYDRPPQWGDHKEDIENGFTGQELVNNRKLCFYEGLKMIRWSYARCGQKPGEKLKVYASGSCDKGGEASKRRIFLAERFWQKSKDQRDWNDEDIVNIVQHNLSDQKIAETNSEMTSQPIPSLAINDFKIGWQKPELKNSNILW